jgi:hypothetical protein
MEGQNERSSLILTDVCSVMNYEVELCPIPISKSIKTIPLLNTDFKHCFISAISREADLGHNKALGI